MFNGLFEQPTFLDQSSPAYVVDEQNFTYDHQVFEALIEAVRPSTIIEVGTWKGHSANFMADLTKKAGLKTAIVCVDTWLGSQEHYNQAALKPLLHIEGGRPTLWERFAGNTIARGNQDVIHALPLPAFTASDVLSKHEVRAELIYIDASHEYEDVLSDIRNFTPLLAEGGLMFGDDFHHPPVIRAVHEFAAESGYNLFGWAGKWLLSAAAALPPGLEHFQPLGAAFPQGDAVTRIEAVRGAYGAPVLAAAYPNQRHAGLHMLLGPHPQSLPDVSTYHVAFDEAFFTVGTGFDGVIYTREGAPVEATGQFRATQYLDPELLRQHAVDLPEEVFVGFNCVWGDYYHWLCMFFAKALIGKALGVAPRVALPDYDERAQAGAAIGFSRETYRQSLYLSELGERGLPLKTGIYRARRVHTVLLDHPQPAFLSLTRAFDAVFEPIRRKLRRNDTLPRRVYVKPSFPLLPDGLQARLERRLEQAGFVEVALAGLDFVQQAELFMNARALVGAHGFELANLVFGEPALSVLELNRQFDGEAHLRPWFYLLAMGRGQTYRYLDVGGEADFDAALGGALAGLTSPLPALAR